MFPPCSESSHGSCCCGGSGCVDLAGAVSGNDRGLGPGDRDPVGAINGSSSIRRARHRAGGWPRRVPRDFAWLDRPGAEVAPGSCDHPAVVVGNRGRDAQLLFAERTWSSLAKSRRRPIDGVPVKGRVLPLSTISKNELGRLHAIKCPAQRTASVGEAKRFKFREWSVAAGCHRVAREHHLKKRTLGKFGRSLKGFEHRTTSWSVSVAFWTHFAN
jgi:hypothetical protein